MARSSLFFGIIACLVLVVGGCVKDDSLQLVPIEFQGDTKDVPIAIEGDQWTLEQIEIVLESNNALHEAQNGYSILLVEPEPGVDYLIARITPDPTIGYKIRIIDPKSGKEIDDLSRQLGDTIREIVMQEQDAVAD